MKVTQSEHQQINEFIEENPDLFKDWQLTDGSTSNLFSAAVLVGLIVSFCENIHKLDEGVTTIKKVLDYGKKLLHLQGSGEARTALSPRERVTMILFDTYAKTRKGMSPEKLVDYTGINAAELEPILADLVGKEIIRKTVTGNFIYKN